MKEDSYAVARFDRAREQMNKNVKLKKFTVVGYWDETQEPFVEWVEAKDEAFAVEEIIKGTDNADQMWVICVLPGHLKDGLGLNNATRAVEVNPEEIKEKAGTLVKTVTCSLCGESCREDTAHLHQEKWIGDECCWDEKLRASE